MKYTVYIQSINNFPIADWAVSAYMGFRDRQADIVLFEDIEQVPASPYNIVVGFIEDTNRYFEKLGLPPKMALNIPESIEKYAGRDIERMTMGAFKRFVNDGRRIVLGGIYLPVFIKPDGKAKQFVAGVIRKAEDIDFYLKDVPDQCPVLISEPVNFISEYRGYVIDGELKGLYWYLGDFKVFPDVSIIEAAIKDYKDAPAGYSIDFGITDDGRTLLIECNDGWSLGNYGLNNSLYCTLLTKRWLELFKK